LKPRVSVGDLISALRKPSESLHQLAGGRQRRHNGASKAVIILFVEASIIALRLLYGRDAGFSTPRAQIADVPLRIRPLLLRGLWREGLREAMTVQLSTGLHCAGAALSFKYLSIVSGVQHG